MAEVEQRSLKQPGAETFDGESLPDILECIAGWLRSNPHVSVLDISTHCSEYGENVVVYYEW